MPIPAHSRQEVLAGPHATLARSVAPDCQAAHPMRSRCAAPCHKDRMRPTSVP